MSLACSSSTTSRLRASEAALKCAHFTRNPASSTWSTVPTAAGALKNFRALSADQRARARFLVGLVLPEHFESVYAAPFGISGDEVAGHGKHGLNVGRRRKKPVQPLADPIVQVASRSTSGHREVQPVDEAGTPQRCETQESRLSFP